MRTTIVIDDHLFEVAKHAALEQRLSFSALVSRAVEDYLARETRPRRVAEFRMPTYGAGPAEHHEPQVFTEAEDDEERYR